MKENQNGQDYVARASAEGRSDVLDWARDYLAPRVQRVFDEFSERYDWGDAGKIQFSKRATRPDEPAGRSSIGRDQGDAVKVEGAVHYGHQKVIAGMRHKQELEFTLHRQLNRIEARLAWVGGGLIYLWIYFHSIELWMALVETYPWLNEWSQSDLVSVVFQFGSLAFAMLAGKLISRLMTVNLANGG